MTGCDIAVIGAGVAGSTAAALLARGGLQVMLIEKGAFPRQKVCGEFLSPEGAEVLDHLGVWPQVEAHHPQRIDHFTLTAGRRQTRHRLPFPGWGVSRWVVDQLLWEHAKQSGVVTHERCTVEQVAGDAHGGFSLSLRPVGQPSTQLRARAVLAAGGRQWRSGRQERTPYPRRRSRYVGLKAHLHGVPLGRHVELHTIRHGYCGVVEVTGGVTNLCCWVEAEALRGTGGAPRHFLEAALRDNAYLRQRLQSVDHAGISWTTTSFAYGRTVAPIASDIWNIGDCAAMVAPLTGDGMGMGLRAAELAATMMRAVFRQELSWQQAMAEYAHRWRGEFLSRLRWGRGLEAVLLQPRLALVACVALRFVPMLLHQLYRRTRQPWPATGPALEDCEERLHSC